jgi:hypothetical protein
MNSFSCSRVSTIPQGKRLASAETIPRVGERGADGPYSELWLRAAHLGRNVLGGMVAVMLLRDPSSEVSQLVGHT